MKNPIPAQITQVKTMARAVRITVDTQELLTPEQTGELFALYEKVGHFFFLDQPNVNIDASKLPPIQPLDQGEKSPSMRLRAVLYVYWEQYKPTPEFETFYRSWIDKNIDAIKSKLL